MISAVGDAPPASRLLEDLRPPGDHVLALVREVAGELGTPVWWVGGGVRDRILGRPTADLDLVVEGAAAATALTARLARRLTGRVVEHARFLTATIQLGDGHAVDVATARTETYEQPAALPVVRAAPLVSDLERRDFSVNAIALRVAPEPADLCDPCGGIADLYRGSLRVLHERSFRDDPTRILRGVRFEARLGLRLEPETERLAREALAGGALDGLSAERLRTGLELLFDRAELLAAVLERSADLGLLAALDRDLELTASGLGLVRASVAVAMDLDFGPARLQAPRPDRLAFLAATWSAPRIVRQRLAGRLGLAPEERDLLVGARDRVERARERLTRSREAPPHEVERLLRGLGGEELALLAASGGACRAWVKRDLGELRRLELSIRGADLVAAGIAPGPEIGQALEATRAARLDGRLAADGELAFAVEFARRARERPE